MSMSIIGFLGGCAAVTAAVKTCRGLVTATADVVRGNFRQAAYTATGAIVSPVTDAVIGITQLAGDVICCGAAMTERLRRIDEERRADVDEESAAA